MIRGKRPCSQEVVIVLFIGKYHLVPCEEAQDDHRGYRNDGLEDAKATKSLLPKGPAFNARHIGRVCQSRELRA